MNTILLVWIAGTALGLPVLLALGRAAAVTDTVRDEALRRVMVAEADQPVAERRDGPVLPVPVGLPLRGLRDEWGLSVDQAEPALVG